MKTIYRELNRIKDFIEAKLEEHDFYMAREPEEGEDDEELALVHPKVAIGNLPHANFSLYADQAHMYQAPYILVGYETADYDEDSETINILIQACAYTQDVYDAESSFPDNMARRMGMSYFRVEGDASRPFETADTGYSRRFADTKTDPLFPARA